MQVQEFAKALDMPELWEDIAVLFQTPRPRVKKVPRRQTKPPHKKK
jgi:hypothetical protein